MHVKADVTNGAQSSAWSNEVQTLAWTQCRETVQMHTGIRNNSCSIFRDDLNTDYIRESTHERTCGLFMLFMCFGGV